MNNRWEYNAIVAIIKIRTKSTPSRAPELDNGSYEDWSNASQGNTKCEAEDNAKGNGSLGARDRLMVIDWSLEATYDSMAIPVRMVSVDHLLVSLPLYSDGSFPRRLADENRLLIPLISLSSEFGSEFGGDYRKKRKKRKRERTSKWKRDRERTEKGQRRQRIINLYYSGTECQQISLTVNLNANDFA